MARNEKAAEGNERRGGGDDHRERFGAMECVGQPDSQHAHCAIVPFDLVRGCLRILNGERIVLRIRRGWIAGLSQPAHEHETGAGQAKHQHERADGVEHGLASGRAAGHAPNVAESGALSTLSVILIASQVAHPPPGGTGLPRIPIRRVSACESHAHRRSRFSSSSARFRQSIPGWDKLRLDAQCLFVMPDGVLDSARLLQSNPQAVVRLGKIRSDP